MTGRQAAEFEHVEMGMGHPSSYTSAPRSSKLVSDAEVNSVELCTRVRGIIRTTRLQRPRHVTAKPRIVPSESAQTVVSASVVSVSTFPRPPEEPTSLTTMVRTGMYVSHLEMRNMLRNDP